ncbi:MAG: UDP-N-acetylmuramoyl-tripeptide--D-alanyl-D-alanine ligase [Devosiaceae bacterium]|nr:UDP-N-acetylmuramoyl-tripeptide--D-alanyl-D-alanine ligase [Devosiaceae bacterium]
MPNLFSIAEIIKATGGQTQNIKAENISSVSIDSRSIARGALYVPITGDRFDGHDFVENALKNGAGVALVSKKQASRFSGMATIIVPDTLLAMVDIARAARKRSKAKIIAITGSAGKTTTKSMVQQILQGEGKTHASIKSFNNHWGVPLMLANMAADTEFGIFEIGMNHSGEITPLVKLVNPHIALITSIGAAHLGNFDNMEGIAKAKAEIFCGLVPDGCAIINSDHKYMEILLAQARLDGVKNIISYGFDQNSNVRIFDYKAQDQASSAHISMAGNELAIKLKIQGTHSIANGVGALIVADRLGINLGQALENLEKFEASKGRGEVLLFGSGNKTIELIDESYNANPSSMAAALAVFSQRPANGKNRILVLGEMLELGENSNQAHLDLTTDIIACSPDRIYLVGENMQGLKEAIEPYSEVFWAIDAKQICPQIVNGLDWGDQIMVKGSNGVGLSHIVEAIRSRFAGA